jgi:hypothetical protein
VATVRTRGCGCPLASRSVRAARNWLVAASRPVTRRRMSSSAARAGGRISAGVRGSSSTTLARSDSRTSWSRSSQLWSACALSTAANNACRTARIVPGVSSLSRAARAACNRWEVPNSTIGVPGRCCSHPAATASSTAAAVTTPGVGGQPGSPGAGPGPHSQSRTVIRPWTAATARAWRTGDGAASKAAWTPVSLGMAARSAGPSPPSRSAWATAGASSRSYRIPGAPSAWRTTRASILASTPVPSSATAISVSSSADSGPSRTRVSCGARSSAPSQSPSASPASPSG